MVERKRMRHKRGKSIIVKQATGLGQDSDSRDGKKQAQLRSQFAGAAGSDEGLACYTDR